MAIPFYTVTETYDEVRALVNYDSTFLTDAILAPFGKKAYDEFQLKCNRYVLSINRADVTFTSINSGVTDITRNTTDTVAVGATPKYPSGLIRPLDIYGATNPSSSATLKLLERRNWQTYGTALPTTLTYWTWFNLTIKVFFISAAYDLQLQYIKSLPSVDWTSGAAVLPAFEVKSWLACRISAIVAAVIKKDIELAKIFNDNCTTIFDDFLAVHSVEMIPPNGGGQ